MRSNRCMPNQKLVVVLSETNSSLPVKLVTLVVGVGQRRGARGTCACHGLAHLLIALVACHERQSSASPLGW